MTKPKRLSSRPAPVDEAQARRALRYMAERMRCADAAPGPDGFTLLTVTIAPEAIGETVAALDHFGRATASDLRGHFVREAVKRAIATGEGPSAALRGIIDTTLFYAPALEKILPGITRAVGEIIPAVDAAALGGLRTGAPYRIPRASTNGAYRAITREVGRQLRARKKPMV